MKITATALGILALPLAASAHHSLAEFSGTAQQELEGEVLRVMWSNPHIRFTLGSRNDAGEMETWQLTGQDLNNLDRREVPRNLVAVGDVIRVAGNLSNRRARNLYVSNLLTANGTEIIIRPTAEPMWSQTAVGLLTPADDRQASATEGQTIFRVWSRHGSNSSPRDSRYFPFTAAAVAARSAWDEDDNFAARCEPEGMPRIMTNPHPFEFVDQGATIALRSELYDLTRVIHIDDALDPATQSATSLGYSVGRWEDQTLIVSTSRVNWPYFDNIGTPQTEAAEYVERFALSDDGSRLDYRLVITDPTTFSEPAVYERYWLALGEDLQAYNCQVY